MLKQALEILEKMDQTDANVIALKQLLTSTSNSTKLYMLYYKGEPLRFYSYGNEDAEFCNGTTFQLTTDKTDPIWTTDDLITAVYNKYIQTPWYNSTLETLTHDFKPEDLEVRDTEGKVYNRKLLTVYTMYKIRRDIWNWTDQDVQNIIDDPKSKETYLDNLYEQKHYLADAKQRYFMAYKITSMNLCQLYDFRKILVQEKCKKLKQNKSYKAIQKQLDKVNKKIVKLGGR